MAAEELQDGWEKKTSRSDPTQVYFLHPESGRTQWEPPLKRPRIHAPALAPHLTRIHAPALAPHLTRSQPAGGPKLAANLGGDLFAGLPEAAEITQKVKEKIPEKAPKPLTSVRALHLLKKHTGSRRPSSWREKVIKRSEEEAIFALKEFRKRLVACESKEKLRAEFERLARKESDCGSAHEGGSLGKFGRGTMQPAFEEGAFALQVDELSGIVTSDSGVHLILRVE